MHAQTLYKQELPHSLGGIRRDSTRADALSPPSSTSSSSLADTLPYSSQNSILTSPKLFSCEILSSRSFPSRRTSFILSQERKDANKKRHRRSSATKKEISSSTHATRGRGRERLLKFSAKRRLHSCTYNVLEKITGCVTHW